MPTTKTARIAQLYGYGNSLTTEGTKEEVPVFPRTASSGVIHKNADGSQTDVQTALNELKAYADSAIAKSQVIEIDGVPYTESEKVVRGRRILYYTPVA